MERKIGDTFKFKDVTLRVEKAEQPQICTNCYFDNRCAERGSIDKTTGNCIGIYRTDHLDVIFVECKDEPTFTLEEYQEIEIPNGFEFDRIENGKVLLKKQIEVSLNGYDSCASYLNSDEETNQKSDELFDTFKKLLTCYNAWVKYLNYKPNWNDKDEVKHCIHLHYNGLIVSSHSIYPRILAFPTSELAYKFLNTFRHDIEVIKILL